MHALYASSSPRPPASLQAWLHVHRALWWAIGIGVLARIAVLAIYSPWDPAIATTSVMANDAGVYHRLALCLLEQQDFCLNTNRTPGYPAFVAAVYALFGVQPWVVLVLQVLIDAATITLTYALGVWLFSPTVAAAAALLLAVDPTSLFISSSLLTDSLFTLLFLCAVALFLRGLDSARLRWALATGLALGLAAWVRPSAQYLPVLLFAAALCRPGWPWTRRVAFGAAALLAFVLTISPWLHRNHQQFDAWGLATVKGETLLNWQAALFLAWRDHRTVEAVRKDLAAEARSAGWVEGGNPFDNAAVQEQVALGHIRAQPLAYASAMLRGMAFMYLNTGTDRIAGKLGMVDPAAPRVNRRNDPSLSSMFERALRDKGPGRLVLGAVLATINLMQYALALVGCWIAWRNPRWRRLALFFMLLVAYFTVTSGVSAEARYKMPVTPLYLLLAGLAVQAAWQRRRR